MGGQDSKRGAPYDSNPLKDIQGFPVGDESAGIAAASPVA